MGITHRKRLGDYNYLKGATTYVSLWVKSHRRMLGEYSRDGFDASPMGRVAEEALRGVAVPGVELISCAVLPSRLHFMLRLEPGREEGGKKLDDFVSGAIASTEVRCAESLPGGASGFGLWDSRYGDWLCLNKAFAENCASLIKRGHEIDRAMEARDTRLRIREPLSCATLPAGEYWRGIGRTALLCGDGKLLAVRISRKVERQADLDRAIARIMRGVEMGFVPICGFISAGERALKEALLKSADAQFVQVLPDCMDDGYYPSGALARAVFDGRAAIIGMAAASDEALTRDACENLNMRVVNMAHQSDGGLGCYVKCVDGALSYERL